jgi:uncharacterized protein YjiS (DUF1127 family)
MPSSALLLPARGPLAHARRLWAAYWDNQRRRATVLMLQALDDRILKDIGLTRSEIRSAVFGDGAERPRPYDLHWHRPPFSPRPLDRGVSS